MNTTISKSRAIAIGTLSALALGSSALFSTPAQAKSSNWKKAAIGGAAVTGYGLIKGKGRVSTVGAVATAGSYYMYRKSKKKEQRRANLANRRRYRRNSYSRRYR